MNRPSSSSPAPFPLAGSRRGTVDLAPAPRWRCGGVLLAAATISCGAISCGGDEFETGAGGGPAAATTTTTSSSGEGGSAVSAGEGGGGDGGGQNEGGGGDGPEGHCDPEQSGDVPIPASCGVFVDPGRPEGETGTGAKDDPYRSINDAVAATAELEERRIYVKESVTDEHVVVAVEGVQLHGGLDDQWVHRPEGRTHVRQEADDPEPWAWEIAPAASEVKLRGFRIEGKVATAPGASSIGLAVREATVRLERVDVVAHEGVDGLDGTTPTDSIGFMGFGVDVSLAGAAGSAPSNMSQTLGGSGGYGGVNTRPGCASQGGRGGTGAGGLLVVYQAGDGQRGSSDGAPTGTGGTGASFLDDTFTNCTNGLPGASGGAGAVGTNASAPGTLSAIDGYVPPVANAGGRGEVGDAGGGGGGGRRQAEYGNRGFGGHGGGAGGCGGFGGLPATSGGSSIAILALEATIHFESSVTLEADAGGDGGDAAVGQAGAKGGGGVIHGGDSQACYGGVGRPGGDGGPGGAGAGGHSLGIAGAGTVVFGDFTVGLGAPGSAGASLISEAQGAPPAPGVAEELVSF